MKSMISLFFLVAIVLRAAQASSAEQLKSVDGRTIEADVLAADDAGVTVKTSGQQFSIPWKKLAPDQEMALKSRFLIAGHWDKFIGKNIYTTADTGRVDEQFLVSCAATLDNNNEKKDSIELTFINVGEHMWAGHHTILILQDGQRRSEADSKWRAPDIGDTSIEIVTVALKREDLSLLAKCETLEFKVGYQEIKAPASTLTAIKTLDWFLSHAPTSIRTGEAKASH